MYRNQFKLLRYVVGEFTNGDEYPVKNNTIVMNDDLVLSMVWNYDEKVSLPATPNNQVVIKYYLNLTETDMTTYVCDYIDRGTAITSLPTSQMYTSSGRTFNGWYTTRVCNKEDEYKASTSSPKVINQDLSIYAKWS